MDKLRDEKLKEFLLPACCPVRQVQGATGIAFATSQLSLATIPPVVFCSFVFVLGSLFVFMKFWLPDFQLVITNFAYSGVAKFHCRTWRIAKILT
jgi:hypothetical protein